jgi:dipeptidyl aminopeptidase/acylaminoacyl peptidase
MSGRAILLAVFAVSCLWAQTPEELIDATLRYRTISQLQAKANLVAFTVARPDLEGNVANSDIWIHDAPASRTFALTRGAKADESPHWSNSGEKLAFVSDRTGKRQIFIISPYGGEAEQATKFEKLAVDDFAWMADDSGFIFLAADPRGGEAQEGQRRPDCRRPGPQVRAPLPLQAGRPGPRKGHHWRPARHQIRPFARRPPNRLRRHSQPQGERQIPL